MRKYKKELTILLLQLFVFYLLPLTAGPTDVMGMVILIIFSTFSLSIILGIISKEKIKYAYPITISILFIPTIFIYYNETAFVYAIWYFIISFVGLFIGVAFQLLIQKLIK